MQKLIKNREIIEDTWLLLKDLAAPDALEAAAEANILVPLAYWLENQDTLKSRSGKTGVWLDSHENPSLLAGSLLTLATIAINFPKFADGRGYSIARELRVTMGFKGEIRAIGEVLRDQLFYMARCGFNAFAMRDDQNLTESLAAFDTFTDGYQISADKPTPLFRRRA
jgi:uncharacterized protein (DUF934 family)